MSHLFYLLRTHVPRLSFGIPIRSLRISDLGQAGVYTWKDKKRAGKWDAGLYKPSNYKAGMRYPLVIQTHGFVESQFLPFRPIPDSLCSQRIGCRWHY